MTRFNKKDYSSLLVLLVIPALFLGFIFGTLFAYEQMGKLGEKVFSNSNIDIEIDINETELVQATYPYIEKHNMLITEFEGEDINTFNCSGVFC